MKSAVLNKETAFKEVFKEDAFKGKVLFNEPMARHTSLAIGGPAEAIVFPGDIPSLRHIISASKAQGIPVIPLGGGTNILVRDSGIQGIVVSLSNFKGIHLEDDGITVNVEAGQMLQGLIAFSKRKGITGIEGLSGIPGSVGGAIAGNAGAYGTEIKDVLLNITVLDKKGGLRMINAKDIGFGYRRAAIPEGLIIISAALSMAMDEPEAVSKRADEYLRQKRKAQPLGEKSAGCVFKNPEGMPAGMLIDKAGCKGMRVGDAAVSPVHGNFFINKGRAKADDFLRLMDMVSQRVKEKFSITLEPEIKIIGGLQTPARRGGYAPN